MKLVFIKCNDLFHENLKHWKYFITAIKDQKCTTYKIDKLMSHNKTKNTKQSCFDMLCGI